MRRAGAGAELQAKRAVAVAVEERGVASGLIQVVHDGLTVDNNWIAERARQALNATLRLHVAWHVNEARSVDGVDVLEKLAAWLAGLWPEATLAAAAASWPFVGTPERAGREIASSLERAIVISR